MCQIDFTISASSERLNNISSAQGRYKLTSQSESVNTWTTPFNISDIQDAKTPDIVIEGDYDFNVRVKDSEDIYSEWFVVYGGFKIGNCVPDEPNIAPTVSVAFDSYSMTLPTNQTNLQATASDADGNIVSYLWTKVSGGNVNIVSPTSITTDITGMVEDSYTFRCTVTDNDGLTASDQKDINVFTQQVVYPTINSSLPTNSGTGTLDFYGGQPNQVLTLQFYLTITSNEGDESIEFSSPVSAPALESVHTNANRYGSVTLDNNGNATSNYTITSGSLSCNVTVSDNPNSGNNSTTINYTSNP